MSVTEKNPIGPREEAKKYVILDKDKEGFIVKFINKQIGKGVFAAKQFKAGEFLLEYVGELVSHKEILRRERTYSSNLGSYLYFITWKGKRFGVDATFSNRICRFANDGTGVWSNSIMTLETFDNRPHLCLYASKNIHIGDEIRYDYGVHNLPWRQKLKARHFVHNQGQEQQPHQHYIPHEICKSHAPGPYNVDDDSITKYIPNVKNPYILRSHRKKHRRHYSRYRKLNASSPCQQSEKQSQRKQPGVCRKTQCTSNGASAIVNPCSIMIKRLTLESLRKLQNDTITIQAASTVKSDNFRVDTSYQNDQKSTLSNSLQENITSGNIQEDIPSDNIQDDVMLDYIQENVTLDNAMKDAPINKIEDDVLSKNIQEDVPSDNIQEYVESIKIQEYVQSGNIHEDVPLDNTKECVLPENIQGKVASKNTRKGKDNTEKDVPSDIQEDLALDNAQEDAPSDNIEEDVPSKNTEDVPGSNQKDTQSDNIQEEVILSKEDVPLNSNEEDVPTDKNQNHVQADNIPKDVLSDSIQEKAPSCNIQGDEPPENIQEYDSLHIIQEDVLPEKIQEAVLSDNVQKPLFNIQIEDLRSDFIQEDPPSDIVLDDESYDYFKDDIMSNYNIKITGMSKARYKQSEQTPRQTKRDVCRKLKCISNGAYAIVTPCSVMVERLTLQSLRKPRNDTIPINEASTVKSSEVVSIENIREYVLSENFKKDVPSDNIQHAPSENIQKNIMSANRKTVVLHDDSKNDGLSDNIQDDITFNNIQGNVSFDSLDADVLSDNFQEDLLSDNNQKDMTPNKQHGSLQSNNPLAVSPHAYRNKAYQSDDQLIIVPTANFQDDVSTDNAQEDALPKKTQEDVPFDNLQKDISTDKPSQSVSKLNNTSASTYNQNTIRTRVGVKKPKPYRPCLFCGKPQSKLILHLRRKHFLEERVKRALLLPKILRDREFDKIRKDGMYSVNCKILLDKNLKESEKRSKLLIERRQGKKDLSICSTCNGFYATSSMYKHKYNCPGTAASTTVPVALPVSTIGYDKDPEDFRDCILAKFRRDKVGEICRRDAFIKLLGQQNFNKVKTRLEKKVELTDTIMRDMRRFATLFVEFKLLAEKNNTHVSSSVDILKRENFTHLKDAIVNLTEKEDGTIKSGLKVGLGFLIKKAAKVLKGHYLMQQKDAEAAEVENFSTVLSYFWTSMFSDAEYANVKARQLDLRRPKHLPIEEDIQRLRNYTMTKIDELLNPHCCFTASEYISLRDVLVCRLTLFNARRGGEPSRLLIKEWNDAENDEWINESSVQSIDDPIEKQLIGKFKIAFQSGKNLNQLVPLLIPNDCLKGIRKLADLEIRQNAGVDKRNIFLFPNTKHSDKHIKGWHAVRNVCIEAGLPKQITATSMRHRAATAYAALDVPENERHMFYRHMGHSEDMNRNVYQCPMAIQEVTKVGKFLETLDTVTSNHLAPPVAGKTVDSQERSRDDDTLSSDDSSNSKNYYASNSYSNDSDDLESNDGYIAEDIVCNVFSNKKEKYTTSTASAKICIQSPQKSMATYKAGPSTPIPRQIYHSVDKVGSIDLNSTRPTRRKSRKSERGLPEKMHLSNDSHSDDDGNDNDYSPHSEESSDTESDEEYIADEILHSAFPKRKGQRISWSMEDTHSIREYFSTWVNDTSTLDRKGSLPGKTLINEFLIKYPSVLKNCSMEKRVSLMRTKLYNERNKSRSKLTTYLSPMLK